MVKSKDEIQTKYLQKVLKEGLKSVRVIVPSNRVEEVKSYAKELREAHRVIGKDNE
tara:strand:+ start:1598 stop:1765 length:168 start_codon:yes stop_codon:yes gene_type:complete